MRRARLEAERDEAPAISFPTALMMRAGDNDVAQLLAGERKLFELRREARLGQKAQLRERILQYEKEISGLVSQEDAKVRGIALIERELKGVRELWEQGLVPIQRMMALECEGTNLDGERGRLAAAQAQSGGRIAETQLQIIQIDQDLRSEVANSLREIEAQTAEYVERKVSAEDQLKRIDLIAPQSGLVHELAVHTIGGVVSPADTIMLIVPDSDRLCAGSTDISRRISIRIEPGQRTVLRMSAFNQRTTLELNGEASRIAADVVRTIKRVEHYPTMLFACRAAQGACASRQARAGAGGCRPKHLFRLESERSSPIWSSRCGQMFARSARNSAGRSIPGAGQGAGRLSGCVRDAHFNMQAGSSDHIDQGIETK